MSHRDEELARTKRVLSRSLISISQLETEHHTADSNTAATLSVMHLLYTYLFIYLYTYVHICVYKGLRTLTCMSEHVAPSPRMSDHVFQLDAGCDAVAGKRQWLGCWRLPTARAYPWLG